jgi:hypothetical protein
MQDAEKSAAEKAGNFVANRAKEPTSWAGLVQLGLAAWTAFQIGDISGAVTGGILVVTGLVSIFRKERKTK